MADKIKDYIVYVDMDGVVADFDAAVKERFGKDMGEMKKGELWGKIKHYNDTVAPWFYSLPEMPDAQKLWSFVTGNFEKVAMLTASGSTPRDGAGQKRKWAGEHLGWDVKVNVVLSSGDKAAFANERSILIDDREKAIKPFIAAGGIGILHTSADDTIRTLKVMMEDWK